MVIIGLASTKEDRLEHECNMLRMLIYHKISAVFLKSVPDRCSPLFIERLETFHSNDYHDEDVKRDIFHVAKLWVAV